MKNEQKADFTYVNTAYYYTGVTPNKPDDVPTLFSRTRRAIPLLAATYYCYTIVILLISVYQKKDDAGKVTLYLGNIFIRLTAISKFGTLYVSEERAREAMREMETLFRELVSGDSVVARRGMMVLKALKITGIVLGVLINVIVIAHTPLDLAARKMLYFHYYPYDISPSPVFEITLLTEVMFLMLAFIYIVISDAVYYHFLIHLVVIFKSLSERIGNIHDSAKKNVRAQNVPAVAMEIQDYDSVASPVLSARALGREGQSLAVHQISQGVVRAGLLGANVVAQERGVTERDITMAMEHILVKCIQQHGQVIRLCDDFSHAIKMASVVQLIVNFTTGLFMLYVTTMSETFGNRELMLLVLTFCVYLQLFLFCTLADFLTEYSLEVGEAAYASDWLNSSARFKYALRMLISRSQRPVYIRAAGVALSRRTFRTVCRAGYYLYIMLSNFYHGVKILRQPQ